LTLKNLFLFHLGNCHWSLIHLFNLVKKNIRFLFNYHEVSTRYMNFKKDEKYPKKIWNCFLSFSIKKKHYLFSLSSFSMKIKWVLFVILTCWTAIWYPLFIWLIDQEPWKNQVLHFKLFNGKQQWHCHEKIVFFSYPLEI